MNIKASFYYLSIVLIYNSQIFIKRKAPFYKFGRAYINRSKMIFMALRTFRGPGNP